MRALTVRQPWASLIACGAKTIETRGWKTSYRGPLLIHAGKARPNVHQVGPWWVEWDGDHDVLRQFVPEMRTVSLPLGAVVAVATLADVVPTHEPMSKEPGVVQIGDRLWMQDEPYFQDAGGGNYETMQDAAEITPDLPLGDFTPGRYAWLLTDVRPIDPVTAKGRQGLWTPDDELIAAATENQQEALTHASP